MEVRIPLILFFVALAMCGPGTAQAKSGRLTEQMHFSAEDEGVKKPISIPSDVLAILANDGLVKNALADQKIPVDKLPTSWFSASAIHLSGPDEIDLVVLGEGQLRGANVITYWVFRATPRGHELVFSAPAHDLIVKKTRRKGFCEIELSGETAVELTTVLFRWDGDKYVVFREESGPI